MINLAARVAPERLYTDNPPLILSIGGITYGEVMIHYHGTPISGKAEDAARFLPKRHALVSFAYPSQIGIVADVCQSFVLDNGAFTVWKKGGQLDLEGYYTFVDHWHKHPCFDWALIPDVIDGDEDDNDKLLQQWPNHLEGVPVWHLHESLDRLNRLSRDYKRVALGSSGEWPTPNAAKWWLRMSEVMDAFCDEQGRPPCKLHGLRMLNPKVFTRLPLASADSTNAGVNSGAKERFGMYTPPTSGQRANVIADRIEAHNSAPVWEREPQGSLQW